ncbi:ABC transporter substrate-binding protein [Ulvibacterium sp.]|uniref:ABC transporter substrate-binding protein n=1 Tax=Ulvibacterium sp. TaxID=2665914 RepID=UPI003BA94D41
MRKITLGVLVILVFACKPEKKEVPRPASPFEQIKIAHAKGFSIEKNDSGITTIQITSPWPNSEIAYTYALIPKDILAYTTLNRDAYDAIVTTPVERIIVTSTTHIPALEALGVMDKLVGFPTTDYISSKTARKQIDEGKVKELGNNEEINTEMTLALNPDVVVGFGISNQNKAYETLQRSNIPVVYNGDWTEETPLGKAEWIKFFAPFFGKEAKADSVFKEIEKSYKSAKILAQKASVRPTVLTGGLYKDVWYVAGGNSWMARFLEDAQTNYLWADTEDTGSLSLSMESVLSKAQNAEFWLNPSRITSYDELKEANRHYLQFAAYENRSIYSNTITQGDTGGLIYYELAPQRPDLVLKDLIHIFHPELLPDHKLFFFKPLE